MKLFDLGEEHEERAIRIMRAALRDDPKWEGFSVEQQQMSIPENPHGIHGKLDCRLKMPLPVGNNKAIFLPLEVKGLNEHVYKQINTVEDMVTSTLVHVRKYPAQLCLYEYFTDTEWGMFVLVNKTTGDMKFVPSHLDLEYAEELLQKADRVKVIVKAYKKEKAPTPGIETDKQKSLLPERMIWTQSICGRCPYLSHCMPDMSKVEGVESLLGNEEFDNALATMKRHEKAGKAFAAADRAVKEHLKTVCRESNLKKGESKTFLLPSFNVEIVMRESVSYPVPMEIKKPYAKPVVFPKITNIEKVGD
jgi:hypothetical protein